MSKYETISQREEIEEEKFGKILDYFERQGTCKRDRGSELEFVFYYDKLHIELVYDNVEIWSRAYNHRCEEMELEESIMEMPLDIFHDNLVGIYASLKNYINNKSTNEK